MSILKNTSLAALTGGAAIVMTAEPHDVKLGGACLMAIASVIADLQSGKRIGHTDKMLAVLRKTPGMQEAGEAELLGLLTYGACAFLGGGELMRMIEQGRTSNLTDPGYINLVYNLMLYPLGGAIGLPSVQNYLTKAGAKSSVSFSYRDAQGQEQKSAPISTYELAQQAFFFCGASGIAAFGTALGAPSIQATGALFMLSNGINIGTLSAPAMEAAAMRLGILRNLAPNVSSCEKQQYTSMVATEMNALLQQAGIDKKHSLLPDWHQLKTLLARLVDATKVWDKAPPIP